MKKLRRSFCFLLALLLLLCCCPTASAEGQRPFPVTVFVGLNEQTVRCFADSYVGNLYLSLADLSVALNGTKKQFRLSYSAADQYFTLDRGKPSAGGGKLDLGNYGVSTLYLYRNRILVDGADRRYYTYQGGADLYMNLTDVQLLLDLKVEPVSETVIRLYPDEPFTADLKALEDEGYFELFNGVLLGDAETGDLLFTANHDRSAPVASISKLMTYLLLREAADAGEISLDDTVTVCAEAAMLSGGPDSMVSLYEGQKLPLSELVSAMLLASSNECALALAVHIAGSEAAFVERMNKRAAELELRSARFYSPHGLPSFSSGPIRAKRQNCMSALDLFRLCRTLLEHYPDVTEITSQLFCEMPSLDYICANSNPLVFNMEGISGLKTGSTNKAGSCLAATMPVKVGGETHTIVLILLGAETAEIRGQASEILLRWARQQYA